MDRDKVKVILKDAISKAFEKDELESGRDGLVGDETINLMAESALNVLLAVEDVQDYLRSEDLLR